MTMRLALGPLAYYWPRQQVLALYADVAAAPVDVVYLGETICSRRRELRWSDWIEIAEMLAVAGCAGDVELMGHHILPRVGGRRRQAAARRGAEGGEAAFRL
jgi:hypothetical protein